MKLLDTTFLAHYYRGDERVESFLETHDDGEEDLVTSTINVEEIAVGVHTVEDDPSLESLLADLGWLTVLPFEPEDAFSAAGIEAALHGDDTVAQDHALAGDVLIAGVAENRGATVVTENVADFETLGVPVESY
ncbi:virulence-associated protein [Halosimplex carlsbadense 2-9-1]|uniref:Virulence-associated protein n=1 Tax=Halosimplex carlsbadense 2-9-1 TaxID=797114 RepID=M0D003_9EURY|nr:PIN domain-containing protein [Halosimplex carlsbadense]ELZ28831.1 virulence-associated protein [Halosimplex carlsbadense 2-9-1]